jgi:hypothetical protein
MRAILCLVALISLWAMSSAAAQTTQAPPACTPAIAAAATIETVRSDLRNWAETCVTLRGIAVDNRLYADREAMAEPIDLWGEDVRRSIVVSSLALRRSAHRPRQFEVTGRVHDCAILNLAGGVASGFCHTSMEPYIEPTDLRIAKARRPQR